MKNLSKIEVNRLLQMIGELKGQKIPFKLSISKLLDVLTAKSKSMEVDRVELLNSLVIQNEEGEVVLIDSSKPDDWRNYKFQDGGKKQYEDFLIEYSKETEHIELNRSVSMGDLISIEGAEMTVEDYLDSESCKMDILLISLLEKIGFFV